MLEEQIAKLESVGESKRDEKAITTYKGQLSDMKKKLAEKNPVDGCVERGYDEQYSVTTFDAIRRFSGYSFNRSHSAAYGMISYWTAYLKTHYPVEFMAALLTVEAGNSDDTINNIQEARRLGIEILPPHINKSKLGYSIELIAETTEDGRAIMQDGQLVMKKAIRYGLESIKGIGIGIVEEILRRPARDDDEESEGEPYKDFDDFFSRVDKRKINKNYMEKLIRAGCFDFHIENRHTVLNHFHFNCRGDKEFLGTHEQFLKAKKDKKVKSDTAFRLNPKDYNEDKVCEYESELFGFYLSYHPYQDLPFSPWHEVNHNQEVDMGGKIVKMKKIKTRNKEDMCFLSVETAGGIIEVVVFPNMLEQFEAEIFKGNIAIFRGRRQQNNKDEPQLVLNKVLKARKKKFQVEKPPELEQLGKDRKKSQKNQQMTLEDFGGPTVKKDPLAEAFNQPLDHEYADGGNWIKEEIREIEASLKGEEISASAESEVSKGVDDLASLFDE